MCCYSALSPSPAPIESTVDPTAKSACVLITAVVIVNHSPSSVTAGSRLELPVSECERTPRNSKVFGFHPVDADATLPPSHVVVRKSDFHVSAFLT